jgi:hypothetical protein
VRFWLGTHEVSWLARTSVPLFISHRRLALRKSLPVALGPWALDSGGYSELGMYGAWRTGEDEYVEAVERYQAEIGGLAWAAPQDWMCEPKVLAHTGLTVREHQERTVASYLSLRGRGPFVPVLQGQTLEHYEVCLDLYAQAGVDLRQAPVIGLGTVCRRHRTPEIARIVHSLAEDGLRLHGFGMKSAGVARVAHVLVSADSMAWSTRGRSEWHHERRRLCGGHHQGGCGNCQTWALMWRHKVIDGCGIFGEHTDG